MVGEYRPDLAQIGFRSEGVIQDSYTTTTPTIYKLFQSQQDYGTCTSAATGADADVNVVFTSSTSRWATDRLINSKVRAWTNNTKASYLGEGTIDDNDGTTFTCTTADFGTTPIDTTPYFEINTFDSTPIQAVYVNDLGLTFNKGIELPDPKPTWHKDYALGSRDVNLFTQGKYVSHNTISGRCRVPRLVFFAMGQESVAGTQAPYTHTITGHTHIPSFCMENTFKPANEFLRYYPGTKVNSVKLYSGVDEPLMCDAELFTARPHSSTNTKSTVVADTSTTGYACAAPYRFDQSSGLTYLQTTYATMVDFDWTLKNNLQERWYFRATYGKYPAAMFPKHREYTLNATLRIDDELMWNELMSPSATAADRTASILFTRTASTDTLTLSCAECRLLDAPHPVPDMEELMVKVSLIPQTSTITVIDKNATYMV